jgi:hypothetical protein
MTKKQPPSSLKDYQDTTLGELDLDTLQALTAFTETRIQQARQRGLDAHPMVRYARRMAIEEPSPTTPIENTALFAELDANNPTKQTNMTWPTTRWQLVAIVLLSIVVYGIWSLQSPTNTRQLGHNPDTPDARRKTTRPIKKQRPTHTQHRNTKKQKQKRPVYKKKLYAPKKKAFYPKKWHKSKASLTIYYFRRRSDHPQIRRILRRLPARVVIKKSKRSLASSPLNALWFGSKVQQNTVKRVAYILLKHGVQLRAIRPFQYASKRPYDLQIGTDATRRTFPRWTMKQIKKIKRFRRNNRRKRILRYK